MEELIEQWYLKDTERYEEEKQLLESSFPLFKHFLDPDNGNACWVGEVEVRNKNGELYPMDCEYNPLRITVECPPNYPDTIPLVHDNDGILRKHDCTHLHADSDKICYGMRELDPGCNFHMDVRIKDLIYQIGVFIVNQWDAENNNGEWEDDRLHGQFGFLEHELKYKNIPLSNPCPCGSKNLSYELCHLNEIENLIRKVIEEGKLPSPKRAERNEKCPCGSGIKYKKCCDPRLYFIQHLVQYSDEEEVYSCLKRLSNKLEKP